MDTVALKPDSNEPLQDILLKLQQDTKADLVLLGEALTTPVARIRSLCCRLDQAWQPYFSYLLDTHPCRTVLDSQKFQFRANASEEFPEAFLLLDNGLVAYAGYPVSLDGNGIDGILVIMSRTGWRDPQALASQLAATAKCCSSLRGELSETIARTRLLGATHIQEEFFREYVLDNPAGVSLSECMPPLPIHLPEDQIIERMMRTSITVECNRAMARMCGYSDAAAMMGARPADVHGPEKARRNLSHWIRQNFEIRDAESQSVDGEGHITWIKGSAFCKIHDRKILHCWIMRSDITAEKRYETAIQHKAHHDALTDLPNRYWFQDRIAELIKDHSTRGKRFCIGLLDLNGFKEVNDTLGHVVGDLILQSVAKRLLKGLKLRGAELARLGGDEFAILLPEIANAQQGEEMASTVQDLLTEPFMVEDMQLSIGGSLGLAIFPDSSDNGEDMLRLADVAMYAAKNEGQPFRWYRPDIDKHSKRRLALLTSLGTAIGNGELFLNYQPKIDVKNGKISGFEALLRWQHPQHGLVPPNDFIPFAEASEVIRPLTRWVLGQAIGQASEWLRAGHRLSMAVNISARNLLDEKLEDYILECLERYAFPAELLELEVTESALMTRPAQAMDILQSLRSHGMSISIDDFGTGYSSLAYLSRLPVTTLKVDQTFVKKMVSSKADEQIVRSVISLAHHCNLLVVAEGVEDETTFQALLDMGCDQAQGYSIARPMTAEAAFKWITMHQADSKISPRMAGENSAQKSSGSLRAGRD